MFNKTGKEYLNKILKSRFFGVTAIIVALVAVILIILIDFDSDDYSSVNLKFNEFEYTQFLEEKINKIVSEIDGAGKSKSMVKVENSYEKLYVKDISHSSDINEATDENTTKETYSENHLLTEKDGNQNGLEITEYSPKISGVIIVCKGGDNEFTIKSIKTAVSTLLGISEDKVCVLKSK